MLTVICIMILAFVILGKDINSLLKRVKNVDWRDRIDRLRNRIRPYALKVGRTAARPLLQFYYVMNDEATSVLDKVLIYAAIIYTVSPAYSGARSASNSSLKRSKRCSLTYKK